MAFATIDVTKGITGTIPVANGGTGLASGTSGQFLKFTGSTTLASASAGIQVADQWRLYENSLGDKDPVTVWERIDSTYNGTLGTGMSMSTGVFTFPQTGIWKVEFFSSITRTTNDDEMQFTLKNNSDNALALVKGHIADANSNSVVSFSVLLDITDVSNNNNKVKLVINGAGTSDDSASGNLRGSSSQNETVMTFTRLGDT